MKQSVKKNLENMIREYSYYYYNPDVMLSVPTFNHFVDYIENFDFKAMRKKYYNTWGFHWFNYLEKGIESMWNDLSLESKAIAFVSACRTADNTENASEEAAGEDW